MPNDAPDSTSTDLEKAIHNDNRPSSSPSDDEMQSIITSPDVDPPSKEAEDAQHAGVKAVAEPGGVLAKVLSRTTSRRSVDPGPPPDGGLAAWTQVVMCHLIVFNTWGYINSFGVFQTYYVATLGHPPSDISWVCTFR